MVIEIFVSVLFMVVGVAVMASPRGWALRVLHYVRFGTVLAGGVAWFRRAFGVLFIAVGIWLFIAAFLPGLIPGPA